MRRGLVIKSTGSWYTVKAEQEVVPCRIKGKFRIKGLVTTNPVTVGDWVEFTNLEDGTGMIQHIEPRKNYLIRKATAFHREAHLLGSNIDRAFVMLCMKHPETPREFIDRFLITAEAYHIETCLLINKTDVLEDEDKPLFEEFMTTYRLAGYTVLPLSVSRSENIGPVKQLMQGGVNLIAGNSGVGKSSLINTMNPQLQLKTTEISDAHRSGKHTTTFSEMFSLDPDTYIIDTPGIRGFGLVDIEKPEVGLYFPEIFRISKNCRFVNCTHLHEPGCAVQQAVAEGNIGESRFNSYVSIMLEEQSKYRQ